MRQEYFTSGSRRAGVGVGFAALFAGIGVVGTANAKSFIDYVEPTPITCSPLSSATWGVAGVLPRDTCNGIESARGAGVPPEYYYWDGQIIRAKDGVYHLFMSTWAGSTGFQNWGNSEAYHAVSTQGVLGPYMREGYVWDGSSHHGHNVSAAELLDGTYAVVVSEVVPFTIYKSASLDGPWTACPGGELIRVPSGVNAGSDRHYDSNVSLTARADGKFEIVQRHGLIAIADTLCGPYTVQKPTWTYPPANLPQGIDSIYPHRTSVPDPAITNPTYAWEEDPHIWYSGGVYHVIYSGSGDRIGWHLYSVDGITDWKDGGLAFDPRMYEKLFCYEGSTTCTQWYKMERPSVVLEGGHVTHVTWAVADVDKDYQIPAGSNHGSKVIVVPFDGVAFDNDYGVGGGNAGAGGADAGTDGGSGGSGGSGAEGGRSGSLSGGAQGIATGGSPGAGGATGTGGGIAVGGVSGSGATGSGAGGTTGFGGVSPSGGTDPTTRPGDSNGSSSGCSCRIQKHEPARPHAGLLLLGWALLPLVRRRGSEKCRRMRLSKPSYRARFILAALLFASLMSLARSSLADNPIVQTNYTADPAPMVYDGRLYVYTSHDEDVTVNNFFTMNDWRLYSTVDMVNWTDHGSPASYHTFSWGTGDAWAPQGVARNGKFYLYVPLNNSTGSKIGVLVADSPAGPFTDPLGKALISTGGGNIDPTVFIDDDGQAYLYWGNPDLRYVKLNADMISYPGSPTTVTLTTAGFGTRSNSDRATAYEEGPWFYKRNSLYYLVYPADGVPEKISYTTSNGPLGPWTYRGDVMAKESGAGSSFTNHPGVIDYKGHSFFFYHDGALPGGGGFKRSVCVEEFTYGADGSIPTITMSSAGPNAVENLNPFQQVEAETIAFSAGLKTEPCSEGGIDVTQISDGDYIKVRNVDFGTGATSFDARVASAGSGGDIELHLDSQTGMLLGTCSVSGTGGAQTWMTTSCAVNGATGVHDLFLRFTGGGANLFNFNWWKFTPRDPMGGTGGATGAGGTDASLGGAAGGTTATGGGAPIGGTSGSGGSTGASNGGASTSGTAGVSAAAGSSSASGGTSPAGVAGMNPLGNGTPSTQDDPSGCGCSVPGRRGEPSLASLVSGLLLVSARRRRRRR